VLVGEEGGRGRESVRGEEETAVRRPAPLLFMVEWGGELDLDGRVEAGWEVWER
jgi:hypothetical protein